MPLPDVSDVCVGLDVNSGLDLRLGVTLAVPLSELKITMPGGLKLQAKASQKIPNPGDLVADLLGQLNSALVPLQPIFDILDILLVIVKVFDAVKSLNPFKIADAVVGLIKKVDVVAAYIPILSIPIMIRDVLDVIIVFLAGLEASLNVQVSLKVKLDASTAKADALIASGDPIAIAIAAQLHASLACGQANLNTMFAAQSNSMKPLNRFLGLLSGLMQAVGLPELPGLTLGADASVALTAVKSLVTVLTTVRVALG